MAAAKLILAAQTNVKQSRSRVAAKGNHRAAAHLALTSTRHAQRSLNRLPRNRAQRQKSGERTLFEAANPAISMKNKTDQNASHPRKLASYGFVCALIRAKRTPPLKDEATRTHPNPPPINNIYNSAPLHFENYPNTLELLAMLVSVTGRTITTVPVVRITVVVRVPV